MPSCYYCNVICFVGNLMTVDYFYVWILTGVAIVTPSVIKEDLSFILTVITPIIERFFEYNRITASIFLLISIIFVDRV